jgi:hypothetical protein
MKDDKNKPPATLKGWQQIADFLGEPLSVVQRWGKRGMPIARQGRIVTAPPDALNEWLGQESGGKPVHSATAQTDLLGELKRGLLFVRGEKVTPVSAKDRKLTSLRRLMVPQG